MELSRVARMPAVLVAPEASVSDVVRQMVEERVGAVVIVNPKGYPLGIFTERDLLNRVVGKNRDAQKTAVSEVMSTPVITANADTSCDDALASVIRSHARHLPILDSCGTVVGMASLRHLLMRRVAEKEQSIETLEAYVHAGGPG